MATKVKVDGHITNLATARMIKEAERISGCNLIVTQGSYNVGGVAASAGTHDGGGVVDFAVGGLTLKQINKRIRALRTVGFAAWHRSAIPGVWGEHIHAVAGGTYDLAPLAKAQWIDYRLGRNGLKGHAADRHLKMMVGHGGTVHTWTWSQYKHHRDAA